ncbi:MAG: glycoside hydrolase family 3 protein, partial [Gloeomargaritaceae cyanobacterium C42_A2020_066]|nr:glycoside hydrolase family 3 protein [Gloeomargaritaceae cyanobacterium C42_A2020_066]
ALGLAAQRVGLETAVAWAEQIGQVMAAELRALGIGWNLAPVLDVVGAMPNPGLGLRALGGDPATAGRLGAALIHGMKQGGILTCAKHFPGLGEARVDPHLDLPQVEVDLAEFGERHWPPFRAAIAADVPAVMTTHVVVPRLDAGRPATFSPAILNRLRQDLGFRGVCVSDDLDMGAITRHQSIPQAAVAALQAGHDLVIVGHAGPAEGLATTQAIAAALATGALEGSAHEQALARLAALAQQGDVAQVLTGRPAVALGTDLADAVATASVQVICDPQGLLPLSPGRPVQVIVPDVRPVADWVLFESAWFEPDVVARLLVGERPAEVVVSSLEARPDALALQPDRVTLLLLYDAQRHPGQGQVLHQCLSLGLPLVVLPVRNPWDGAQVPESVALIETGGFRVCQLRAAGRWVQS